MNTTNNLIGKKVRGFKFEKEDGRIYYSHYMNDKIGSIGIITEYDKEYNTYKVAFENDFWAYPAELIEQHLVEETPLDDLPIIGDGVLMEVSDDEEKWFERKICGNTKLGLFIAWIEDEGKTFYAWKYARPITPKTKITRKEFESKFEIID